MKKYTFLAICLLPFTAGTGLSQDSQPNPYLPGPPVAQARTRMRDQTNSDAGAALTKFDLDFPGGAPAELVSAIEKSSGKPLNAIIPTEDAAFTLPPLKMSHVNVAQIFSALGAASRSIAREEGAVTTSSYSFDTPSQPVTDDSIWYFTSDATPPSPKNCMFFSLEPYLNRGFTVDDITTAIRTGWELQAAANGLKAAPQLTFHKETKLLIVVGDQYQIQLAAQALQALPPTNAPDDEIKDIRDSISDLKIRVDQLEGRFFLGHRIQIPLPSAPSPANSPAK